MPSGLNCMLFTVALINGIFAYQGRRDGRPYTICALACAVCLVVMITGALE